MYNSVSSAAITEDVIAHVDFIWSDNNGVGVTGWLLSRQGAPDEVLLCVDGATVPITNWHARPDLLAHYPQYQHTERCGFHVHVPRIAQYELAFQVRRLGETVIKPMTVAAPAAAMCPYTDAGNLFNEFIALVNEGQRRVLEIGSRVVSPGSSSKRVFFPGARSYTGFDYYPDANTDVVGDAHKLAQYFGAQRFDAIFSLSVFEHLAMPWVVAMEINKLLEVGGLTYHASHFAWPLHEAPWDFWRFSDEGLKVLFSPALGFEVVKAGLFSPMRLYLDQVVPAQEMMPFYPAFGGVAILARKVAELDQSQFRWDTDVPAVVGGSHYPQP
jgi:hypothetical protein